MPLLHETKQKLQALQGAIDKWQAIVDGTGIDGGLKDCPLCQLYYSEEEDNASDCKGCPISEKAQHPNCRNTAYSLFKSKQYRQDQAYPLSPETKAAAQEFLTFLQNLLTEENTKHGPSSYTCGSQE